MSLDRDAGRREPNNRRIKGHVFEIREVKT